MSNKLLPKCMLKLAWFVFGSFGLDSSQVGGWGTSGFRRLDSSKLQDSTSNEATDAFLNPLFTIIPTFDVMFSL